MKSLKLQACIINKLIIVNILKPDLRIDTIQNKHTQKQWYRPDNTQFQYILYFVYTSFKAKIG